MIEVYSAEDYAAAWRKLKALRWLGLGIVVGLVIESVCVMLIQTRQTATFFVLLMIVSTVVALSTMLLLYSTKYRIARAYVRLMKDIMRTAGEEIAAEVVSFDPTVLTHDGLPYVTVVANVKPLRRNDITERNLLLRAGYLPPEGFAEGARLRVVCLGNVVVKYQVQAEG